MLIFLISDRFAKLFFEKFDFFIVVKINYSKYAIKNISIFSIGAIDAMMTTFGANGLVGPISLEALP